MISVDSHLMRLRHTSLLIHSKTPQILHLDPLQRALIRRLEHDFRHLPIGISCPCFKRLFPAIHAQAPFAAVRETGLAQVVAARGAEVEEFVGYDG
jgi:hypothetical protein